MAATAPTDFSDKFLLTIHGVTSDNQGLRDLRVHCENQLPGLISDSFYYERVMPFKSLTKPLVELLKRTIREKLELTSLKHLRDGKRKLFVVAHSFGTLALIDALKLQVPNLQIEGLVLLGSIVPRNQIWDGFVDNAQIKAPPLVIVRPFDKVVRLSHFVGGEPSGSEGFIAVGQHLPIEHYKNGGHTSYYPDDREDIVNFIRSGIPGVCVRNYAEWYDALPNLKKLFARRRPG